MRRKFGFEGVMNVNRALFADLVKSLKEAADIAKGKAEPSRRFEVLPPDVKGEPKKSALPKTNP